MKQWSLTLELSDVQIPLTVEAPTNLAPIEEYREVNFLIPGKGRHRAVFFLLPDRSSMDSYAVMPTKEWNVPVRWDDNAMLFVPSLDDNSILSAMKYIFQNGMEASAFENDEDTTAAN
jgi:hypothetical protein